MASRKVTEDRAAVDSTDSGESSEQSVGTSSEDVGPDHRASSNSLGIEHQLSRGVVLVQVVETAVEEAGYAQRKGWCTANVRALAISCLLFSLITVAQVFAAKMAHSDALLMDCISMGVDAGTYLGNIFVECRKRKPGEHVVPQLLVVAASLGLLYFFTVQALQESWGTVLWCRHPEDFPAREEDGVNGWITLSFALGGVAFDVVCMAEFLRSHKKTASGRQVNMFSAFLHVGADFLRSTSTTVMSLVILCRIGDSTCVDAYTSIIIGATIIAGGLVGFWKWAKMLVGFLTGRGRSSSDSEESGTVEA